MKIIRSTLAIAGVLAVVGCDLPDQLRPVMATVNQSQPLAKEKSLDAEIRFAVGSLEVAAESPTKLYSVDLEYDKANFQPEVRYEPLAAGDSGRLVVKLEGNNKIGFRNEADRNRLRLGLSDSVPINLSVNNGVGRARLSLSRLQVARLELETGVGGTKITSYEPNPIACERIRIHSGVGGVDAVGLGNLNFRELEFEGGVGGADLDLTGQWKRDAEIRIQVGVGGVSLRMPRDLGVEVQAEKHFLSGFRLDGFVKRDNRYYSENYDKAKIRVLLQVSTGIGGFSLRWV